MLLHLSPFMQPLNSSPPSSMETRRRKDSDDASATAFSFPSTPAHSSSSPSSSDDFEFGCLTPDSPSTDPNKNSPADHLFFNGRLLPHSFPFRSSPSAATANSALTASRGTSRTSSIGSKDYSLVSSRSNSTNSSCSSSARTSSSDNSERRLLYCRQGSKSSASNGALGSSKAVSARVYGSSQRWQFMAPVPALSRDSSRRRKVVERNEKQEKKAAAAKAKKRSRRPWRLGRRLFRWILTACRKCHAIEPSRKDEIMTGKANLR